MVPGMGLLPCLHQERVEACPLPLVGVGSLVLSVKMEVLGGEANWLPIRSWVPGATGGSALEESAGVSKTKHVEEKSKAASCPVPDS